MRGAGRAIPGMRRVTDKNVNPNERRPDGNVESREICVLDGNPPGLEEDGVGVDPGPFLGCQASTPVR